LLYLTYGLVAAVGLGLAVGAPVLLARSADLLGSYYPALYATTGLMVTGAIVASLVDPPDTRRTQG